jgi:hypothetical protein
MRSGCGLEVNEIAHLHTIIWLALNGSSREKRGTILVTVRVQWVQGVKRQGVTVTTHIYLRGQK